MIKLNEITIKNFLSHKESKISFGMDDKLLIDGKSGSGKSSISEAILWTLFGKGRTENRSLIRRGEKQATVALKLDDGSTSTLITRTVSKSGKNTLVVTQRKEGGKYLPIERTGIKDTQDWIEKEFLKSSYELFTNSVAYPQENENSFVKATASKRKDLLLEIVRAGNFDEFYEKARVALNTNENNSSAVLMKKSLLEDSIEKSKEVAGMLNFYQTSYDLSTKQVETCSKTEKVLEEQLHGLTHIAKNIETKKNVREMLISSLFVLKEQLESCEKVIKSHEEFDITIHENNIKEIDVLDKVAEEIEKVLKQNADDQQLINSYLSNRPSVVDYNKEIEDINKRLISLMKETGKCPAGDKCPFLLPVRGQIDFLTEQITSKADKSVAEQVAFEKWETEFKRLPVIKDTNELYNKLKEIRYRIGELSKSRNIITMYKMVEDSLGEKRNLILNNKIKIEETEIKLKSIDQDINDLEKDLNILPSNKINEELSTIRILRQKAQKEVELGASNITVATNALLEVKEASTALVELNKGILVAKEEKELLELIKEAFSPRGVKAVIVDYIIPQLEQRINNILGQLSDFRIRLSTQQNLTNDEGFKEGLFIIVKNPEGEELPLQNLSGGETIKISMAISEGLASLVGNIGFRILDECVTSLDSESTQSFVVVLLKLQEKFPQLLCISHLSEIKDLFSDKIKVVKINGISNTEDKRERFLKVRFNQKII